MNLDECWRSRGSLKHGPLALVLLLTACAPGLPEPRLEDVAVAPSGSRSEALTRLHRGRDLVVQHCAGCHALKPPNALPASAWPSAVAEMRNKRDVRLSQPDADAIVAYLSTMAERRP